MKPIGTQAPEERVPIALYTAARDYLIQNDPDGREMLRWAQGLRPPCDADSLAREIVWIILCAGRSAQAARTIEGKVWTAIHRGCPVVGAFGYRAKAAAIERAWNERDIDFAAMKQAIQDPISLLEWCGTIPFVGSITKFQLAKNLGAQVCKPDIWMCRLAGMPDTPCRPWRERFVRCMQLCTTLSAASGDSVAVVDTMLWLACNKGVISVSPQAGTPIFVPRTITARPIIGHLNDDVPQHEEVLQ